MRKVDGLSLIFIDFYGLFVESVAHRDENFPSNFQSHFTVTPVSENVSVSAEKRYKEFGSGLPKSNLLFIK
jgi:hypothetical protein